MKTALAPLVIAALAGCAPASIEDLRGEHSSKRAVEVDAPYQDVYRTVLSQARKCWQSVGYLAVSGDLFTDTRAAAVQVAGQGGVYVAVDVVPLGEKRSRAVVYNALSTWNDQAETVVEWLRDGSKDCVTQPRK